MLYAEKQQAACAGMKPPERDVSPIQSEIRAANDALDLLHMRIHNLAERLAPVLIQ